MGAALGGVATGGQAGDRIRAARLDRTGIKGAPPALLKTAVMGDRVMGGVGLSQRIAPPVVTVAAAGT